MELLSQIDEDLNEAMRSRDEQKVSVLRMLKSALKNAEIEKKAPLEEQDAIKTLEKQAKQRRDSIQSYKEGNREDLAAKEEAELALISSYLPEKLGSNEVEKIVEETIKELGINEISGMGQVVKAVIAKTAGQADGKTVSDMVRSKLL